MLNVRERREAAAKREAHDLIEEIGIERTSILLDVHVTTVKRWHAGEVVAQTPILIALRTVAGRHWDRSPDWEGWTIRENFLHSPAGERFIPGDLLGRRYQIQLQKHYEGQIRMLKAKIASLQTGAANDAVDGAMGTQSDEMIDYTIGRASR